MRATDNSDNMKPTADDKADKNPPLFSRAYGSELASGAKSGLKFGVTIAAVAAPTLLISYGLRALFASRG